MFADLRNGPDNKIVKDAEGKVAGFWARYPMQPPEKSPAKGGPCKLALKYLGEHDQIVRDRDMLKEELQKRYVYPERSKSGEAEERALMALYDGTTVREYLKKHPEDANFFGLNGFRPDLEENDFKALSKINDVFRIDGEEKRNAVMAICGTFRTERESAILGKSLEQFLFEKPEVGKRLGDKALAFRIQATLRNLKKIDDEYKVLLENLPMLKGRENGFPHWARAYHSMRHGLYKSLWWVRDNPILGLTAVASLLVLLKIGIVLLLLDEAKSGHNEGGHKKKKSSPMPQLEPARAYRPQPPPYQPQFYPQPYYPPQYATQPYSPQPYAAQPYSPQQFSSPQAQVFPAPYFEQTPTPLQTALNMPTT
jgi:hypothetical protein